MPVNCRELGRLGPTLGTWQAHELGFPKMTLGTQKARAPGRPAARWDRSIRGDGAERTSCSREEPPRRQSKAAPNRICVTATHGAGEAAAAAQLGPNAAYAKKTERHFGEFLLVLLEGTQVWTSKPKVWGMEVWGSEVWAK